jgi:outer membrane protein assembly factor BamB
MNRVRSGGRRSVDGRRGRQRLAPAPAVLILLSAMLAGCGGHPGDWPVPNGDLAGTRNARSTLDSSNVGRLRVLWRYRLTSTQTFSGLVAATPIVAGKLVYVQDLDSNVLALDRRTGRLVWEDRFRRQSGGPNGLVFADGKVYGNTDIAAFALDAKTGRLLWKRTLTVQEQPLTIAPIVARGIVVTSTTGESAGGRGTVVGLDAATGQTRWTFATVKGVWAHPELASGGGVWQTPTVDAAGHVWFGTANPNPWGGSRTYPNGGMYPGPVRYTDSIVELDIVTGHLVWAQQVTPHDVRDHDFQDSPVLTGSLVIGAGKAGRVIAWNRTTHQRVWSTAVGLHRNDVGALPTHATSVCPGLLGGVETPLAVANDRVFVPVVDLCFQESALGTSLNGFLTTDYTKGRGRVVALDEHTGRTLWQRKLASPVFGCTTVSRDVVFTVTYAGELLALRASDGAVLWRTSAPAAVNACPAVAGSTLIVAAGAAYSQPRTEQDEVVAYAPSS